MDPQIAALFDTPDSCLYDDVTGIILAGGRGRRLGNADKGLQLLNGKMMVEQVIFRLRPQVASLMISANRNLEQYSRFGYPVYPDNPITWSGPLAGFLTGLKYCRTLYMVTAPCDAPFLPQFLVKDLHRALTDEEADIAVASAGEGSQYRVHPVFCLMKASLKENLQNYLENGGRKIDGWYASLKTAVVHFDDASAFENINTPEDLARLENKK